MNMLRNVKHQVRWGLLISRAGQALLAVMRVRPRTYRDESQAKDVRRRLPEDLKKKSCKYPVVCLPPSPPPPLYSTPHFLRAWCSEPHCLSSFLLCTSLSPTSLVLPAGPSSPPAWKGLVASHRFKHLVPSCFTHSGYGFHCIMWLSESLPSRKNRIPSPAETVQLAMGQGYLSPWRTSKRMTEVGNFTPGERLRGSLHFTETWGSCQPMSTHGRADAQSGSFSLWAPKWRSACVLSDLSNAPRWARPRDASEGSFYRSRRLGFCEALLRNHSCISSVANCTSINSPAIVSLSSTYLSKYIVLLFFRLFLV